MRRIGLCLEPLDTLFFRDGRPFEATSKVKSGLPLPQTLAGALRTWLLERENYDFSRLKGRDFREALADEPSATAAIAKLAFRGPWLALKREGGGVMPLIPAPANLRWPKGEDKPIRLAPLRDGLPGWEPPEPGMRPLWSRDTHPSEYKKNCYLILSGLERFLKGGVPEADEIVPEGDLFEHDWRTGIGLEHERRTAEEEHIYSVGMLALKANVVFYAEIETSEALREPPTEPVVLSIGGERRHMHLSRLQKPVAWPEGHPSGDQGSLLLLTTPGLFPPEHPWRPESLSLVAAAVPGYEAVSGWDMAEGRPKPTRFAAQAGSVYFLEGSLDPRPESLGAEEDAALGWGCCLKGVWSYDC